MFIKCTTIVNPSNGVVIQEEWSRVDHPRELEGVPHRVGAPAQIHRDADTGKVLGEVWIFDGAMHREDGPAERLFDMDPDDKPAPGRSSGRVDKEVWSLNGEFHRVGGPSWTERDRETGVIVTEEWHVNGKLHRLDGPAHSSRDRITGVTWSEEWHEDGQLHRADGPAVISRDPVTGEVTAEDWYHNGTNIKPQQTVKAAAPAP